MMFNLTIIMRRIFIIFGLLALGLEPILTQRNLLVFKQELEYRLGSYNAQRRMIDDILTSSISPNRPQVIQGQTTISHTGARVRFTDLIISNGSLILDRQNARPTVRMLVNRTRDYVAAKMNELYQVKSQLESVKRQIGAHEYIYKGQPFAPALPGDNRNFIRGTRLFKQFIHGHSINSFKVEVANINYTNVDRVMNDTYMANAKVGLLDPQSRLFFEGKKTFWSTTFTGSLRSGCCDRLKPLHTDRMMRKTRPQTITAPIMFHISDGYNGLNAIRIHNLTVSQMYNRILVPGFLPYNKQNNGLIPSPQENLITLDNLIHTKIMHTSPIPKTIIFRDITLIEQARLYSSVNDRGLVLGLASEPGFVYDLNHHNYLLRYINGRNYTGSIYVAGTTVINGQSHFTEAIDATIVNRVPRFDLYIHNSLVRVDRPAYIRGPVQFSALPMIFSTAAGGLSQPPRNVPIIMANKNLGIGLVNGMRIPQDLLFMPPSPYAHRPNQVITIRGPREFVNQVNFEHLHVYQQVNNMQLPQDVIPLHLNDFMGSTAPSNLWFMNGIVGHHMTVQGGLFDNILIKDSDAQNIIMRSVFMPQPDGSHIVRAPLHIMNLKLKGRSATTGLLNNFRPETLVELSRRPMSDMPLFGRKHFINHIEADECIFNDINEIQGWSNHLIRIDRPNLTQNVHSRLSFQQMPTMAPPLPSSVDIGKLGINFYPVHSVNQPDNWNLSPEFYMMHQALIRVLTNNTGGRYRVLDQIRLVDGRGLMNGRVNGIAMEEIVTLDQPNQFRDGFVMVGKVIVAGDLQAGRIHSNYPLDVMDLVQFNQYRVPIVGSQAPIKLSSLVLGPNNQAGFIQTNMLNGVSFNDFVASIMSLTRPQVVESPLTFNMPVTFESFIRIGSSLNNIENFKQFVNNLKFDRYIFEDGLQCNSVNIMTKY